MVTEVERNKAIYKLCDKLIGNKQYDELVMLGTILLGDKHPAVLKSYEVITNMITNEKVVEMRDKIKIKLAELREEYDKEDNTPS